MFLGVSLWSEIPCFTCKPVRAENPHPCKRSESEKVDPIIYDLVLGEISPAGQKGAGAPPGAGGAARAATGGPDAAAPDPGPVPGEEAAAQPGTAAVERFGSSTAFFAERFASAFPGVRSIAWFTNPDDIEQRMLTLLKSPLTFPDGLPVWYWRGGNLQIERFRKLASGQYLMDTEELRIARIAAVHGSSYHRNFVYVHCDPMESTGLYRIGSSDRAGAIEQSGYDYEEYGLVSGTIPITRSEYDDAAAVIDGKLTDVRGRSELRTRYTTPYNFVIAANGSPINNSRFDSVLVEQLNFALSGDAEEVVKRLHALVEALPLRGQPNA